MVQKQVICTYVAQPHQPTFSGLLQLFWDEDTGNKNAESTVEMRFLSSHCFSSLFNCLMCLP